jgi:hypothetical protein
VAYKEGTIKLVVTSGAIVRSLILDHSLDTVFPRVQVNQVSISYSQTNTPFIVGQSGSLPHLWTSKTLMTEADWQVISQMAELVKTVRPRIPVVIHDYTRLVVEVLRTRAIADDATLVVANGMSSYYAKFNGFFSPQPVASKEGRYRDVTIILQELLRLAA